MASIVVAGQTYNTNSLTSVVFPGATATLANGVLTLEAINGQNGNDSAMASIVVAGQTYNANTLNPLVFPGATATLDTNGHLILEAIN